MRRGRTLEYLCGGYKLLETRVRNEGDNELSQLVQVVQSSRNWRLNQDGQRGDKQGPIGSVVFVIELSSQYLFYACTL